ncbi:hypothetical protein HMPREF0673_02745 [Leyella stercorea DSM 18206]|uniref:Uncharacterized protein n=1 Tax=Leyella stercorea DSM 18206 TaxID=1002367 RepID=G6B1H4_9BACT|nr:hypothetical protein HMPREF0673_02745 [Leyella stercorea DSM 18206]
MPRYGNMVTTLRQHGWLGLCTSFYVGAWRVCQNYRIVMNG